MEVEKHLAKLGYRCRDCVTGLEGVITSVSFDLYGCVQVIVHPGLNDKGLPKDTLWYDISRLEITSDSPVMNPPDFQQGYVAKGKKGPAEKPFMSKA